MTSSNSEMTSSNEGEFINITSKTYVNGPLGVPVESSSFVRRVPVKKCIRAVSAKEKSKSTNSPFDSGEGQKWTTLHHNGLLFPPPYKPHGVKMIYKGKPVDLTPEQEEVATMYAVVPSIYKKMLKFNENFMSDWKKILGENHIIQNLEDCDFTPIYEWYLREMEKKKQMSIEEHKALEEEEMKQKEKYMWAIIDGVKVKVWNFMVEPPRLFMRGPGEHPKMGKLKKRIYPKDVTINIGKDAPIPECPLPGEIWKEIRHDNTSTWLAYWRDPINPKEIIYAFVGRSSALNVQSDKDKYEKSRALKRCIDEMLEVRASRTEAETTYLIDKLALSGDNKKV